MYIRNALKRFFFYGPTTKALTPLDLSGSPFFRFFCSSFNNSSFFLVVPLGPTTKKDFFCGFPNTIEVL